MRTGESSEETTPVASESGNFVPVMLPEELPKGQLPPPPAALILKTLLLGYHVAHQG